MPVDVSGVKYIRRTIDTIYPVQLVSNTSLPTVMVRKNKTNADIMEINCMLQIVLSSKPTDFRNTSFFIMQKARDEFCDILKKAESFSNGGKIFPVAIPLLLSYGKKKHIFFCGLNIIF